MYKVLGRCIFPRGTVYVADTSSCTLWHLKLVEYTILDKPLTFMIGLRKDWGFFWIISFLSCDVHHSSSTPPVSPPGSRFRRSTHTPCICTDGTSPTSLVMSPDVFVVSFGSWWIFTICSDRCVKRWWRDRKWLHVRGWVLISLGGTVFLHVCTIPPHLQTWTKSKLVITIGAQSIIPVYNPQVISSTSHHISNQHFHCTALSRLPNWARSITSCGLQHFWWTTNYCRQFIPNHL